MVTDSGVYNADFPVIALGPEYDAAATPSRSAANPSATAFDQDNDTSAPQLYDNDASMFGMPGSF